MPKKQPQQQSPTQAPTEPAPSKPSWKDNPVIVAAGTASATLTATIAVFLQVVLPTREVDLKNRIVSHEATLAKVQASLTGREAELREAQAKLVASERHATTLHSELRLALTAQLFSANDPYPNGLRAVRVGESADAVRKAYPNATTAKADDGVVILKDHHPVFSTVNYFYDADDQKKLISHIVFEVKLGDAFPTEFLQRKLRDALGPAKLGAKPEHTAWIRERGPSVYKAEDRSYLIAAEGVAPKWWKARP